MTAGLGVDPTEVTRRHVELDGVRVSYLHAGAGVPLLLLHGTFWSRVWEPVLPALAATGHEVLAVDFPGFGFSEGQLDRDSAAVPALAAWSMRFLDAVGVAGVFSVGGHDIGGAVAQHLAAAEPGVDRLALMNSVLYDSWPVPAVARFRDPEAVRAITADELLDARRQSLEKAIARPLGGDERDAWLEPWRAQARVRSWAAMAAAADSRYTLELVDKLTERSLPTLLIWGTDDEFQPLAFAERYAREIPDARLVRIDGARHIPSHDAREYVGSVLASFFRV